MGVQKKRITEIVYACGMAGLLISDSAETIHHILWQLRMYWVKNIKQNIFDLANLHTIQKGRTLNSAYRNYEIHSVYYAL